MADPEPESEAYDAPPRSSTRLTSHNSGYCGKTTRSKSFSIPVRTRSRSGVSARPLPRAGTPDKPFPDFPGALSHEESTRPNSFILSEGLEGVNSPSFRENFGELVIPSGARSREESASRSREGQFS